MKKALLSSDSDFIFGMGTVIDMGGCYYWWSLFGH